MDEDTFSLNIENCIADKSRPAVIRNALIEIRDKGYCPVGVFYKDLSDADLDILRYYIELIADLNGEDPTSKEHDEAYENISLLAMALIVGQGDVITEESAVEGIQALSVFTSLEFLYRQNLIDVFRDNWSMDPADDGPVAKAKGQ